jgi:CheY-like chemotaxis protein
MASKLRAITAATVLFAEDDPDDRLLMKEAFAEIGVPYDLRFVGDGEELMNYLRRQGCYAHQAASPTPALILLDLNMPKKDGREAAVEIKADPLLWQIPIVVLTTSASQEDIIHAYAIGVTSFVSKPCTFDGMVALAEELSDLWVEPVAPPVPLPARI